jgi:hypothetical protein
MELANIQIAHVLLLKTRVSTMTRLRPTRSLQSLNKSSGESWNDKDHGLFRLYRNAEANAAYAKAEELSYKG